MHPSFWIIINIATPIVLASAVNAVIYASNLRKSMEFDKNDDTRPKLLPPGYVVAVIWTLIFGLLGYAHYRVFPSAASMFIVVTIAFCLAYPLLTFRRRQAQKSNLPEILNTIALILSAIVFASVAYTGDAISIAMCAPLLTWASYVNIVDAVSDPKMQS